MNSRHVDVYRRATLTAVPQYVGSAAALAALRDGSQPVVVDQVLLPSGQRTVLVRLLADVVPARPAAVRYARRPAAQPWYRRWSPRQILALAAIITAGLVGCVWGVIYAASWALSGAAAHGGKVVGVIIVVLLVLAAAGGGGKTFSGTFKGTIR